MEIPPRSFDVCIVCALQEEASAFIEVVKQYGKVPLEECMSPRYRYSYRFATIKNHKDEPLRLHISWPPRYGQQEMVLHFSHVLEEYQPCMALMTGICAGNARYVHLGDLVVAERVFTYDTGKVVHDEQGQSVLLPDTQTYPLNDMILQFLRLFDKWKPLVTDLKRPVPQPEECKCHIKAMASGSAVRADNPFEKIRGPARELVALDMEAAAFGLIMSRHSETPWLIVKGISDYADRDKNDFYRDYAAQASALYAFSFIQSYVTHERFPQLDGLSSGAEPLVVWNVPYARNPVFTGRERLLAELTKALQMGNPTAQSQPQALSGLGGIGKTQIAVEYAYRHRQDYKAVFWTRADTREALISGYVEIAGLLNLPQKNEQDQTMIVKATLQWLETQTAWLLILDNADDLAIVHEFLPRSPAGHILLTTRTQSMGQLAKHMDVQKMDGDVGTLLLLRRAKLIAAKALVETASESDAALARALTQELDGLPLALDQAGAYIEETGCGLSGYQILYRKHRAKLLNKRGGVASDHPEPVTTTWSLSFQHLNAAAADLLRFYAYLAPDAIPEEIIVAGAEHLGPLLQPLGADSLAFNDAFATLRLYSFVNRDVSTKTVSMHQLVQEVLKEQMDEKNKQQWAERTIHAIVAALPPIEHESWPRWERLLPHVRLCVQYIKEYRMQFTAATTLLNETGSYLARRARYKDAEERYQACMNILKKSPGPLLPIVLINLANVSSENGKYDEAKKLYEESLDIFELDEELDPRQFARLLNNLAILFKVQGKPEDAEEQYIRSLKIYAQSLLTSFQTQGKSDGATEMFYTHGLDIQVQALATFFETQKKPEEVIKLYIHCLLNEKTVVRKFAQVLNNLAVLYAEQPADYGATGQRLRKYETAEKLFHLSLWLQQQHLGHATPEMKNDPKRYDSDYALSLNDLANLYTEWGSNPETLPETRCTLYEMAESLYRDCMDILEKLHDGVDHPDLAYSFHGQGILDFEQGRYEEAKKWYKKSLDIWTKYLQSDHPQIAYVLYNLANLYFAQGRPEEAEEEYKKSLDIWTKHLQSDHIHTRICAKKYVKLLRIHNKNVEAQRIEQDFDV